MTSGVLGAGSAWGLGNATGDKGDYEFLFFVIAKRTGMDSWMENVHILYTMYGTKKTPRSSWRMLLVVNC